LLSSSSSEASDSLDLTVSTYIGLCVLLEFIRKQNDCRSDRKDSHKLRGSYAAAEKIETVCPKTSISALAAPYQPMYIMKA
jgi:hypothetical protein